MPFDLEAVNKVPNLSGFLRYYRSGYGNGNTTQEMYDYFGGDDILKALKKFDPNASWGVEDDGNGNKSYNLQYDQSKLPTNKFGQFLDMKPLYNDHNDLYNPTYKYNDQNWGDITATKNVKKAKDPMWTKLAPLVPGIVAPWAAGMLAGAGVGAGAAGTAAATGSGLTGTAPSWITAGVRSLPTTVGNIASGNWQGAALGAASAAAGAIPGMGTLNSALKAYPLINAAYNMTRNR